MWTAAGDLPDRSLSAAKPWGAENLRLQCVNEVPAPWSDWGAWWTVPVWGKGGSGSHG